MPALPFPPDRTFTSKEAATQMGAAERTVRSWIEVGYPVGGGRVKLEAQRVGRGYRISAAALRRFAVARGNRTATKSPVAAEHADAVFAVGKALGHTVYGATVVRVRRLGPSEKPYVEVAPTLIDFEGTAIPQPLAQLGADVFGCVAVHRLCGQRPPVATLPSKQFFDQSIHSWVRSAKARDHFYRALTVEAEDWIARAEIADLIRDLALALGTKRALSRTDLAPLTRAGQSREG